VHDEAIRTFLLHDHGRVVRAVAAVCGDRERAEDAVQDALVDVWTENRQVDDLTGWVAVAAINRARSRWRSQVAERRAFDRLAAETATHGERHPAESDSPVMFDAHVAETLRDLPRSQRSVVALRAGRPRAPHVHHWAVSGGPRHVALGGAVQRTIGK
jgi:DNA-directed RNA polymerase specialized sigma24 family protein